jgi:hypothetical protein
MKICKNNATDGNRSDEATVRKNSKRQKIDRYFMGVEENLKKIPVTLA